MSCEFCTREEYRLKEEPYNRKKHFLFIMPEIFSFFIKIGILILLSETVMITGIAVALQTDKEWVEAIYESGI